MVKLRNFIMFAVLLFVPYFVYAADAIASNWKVYCDEVTIFEGGQTKCWLMAKIDNATDNGRAINAIVTSMTGEKLYVTDYKPAKDSISVLKTEHGVAFSGPLQHSSAECMGALGCFDFTSQSITNDVSMDVSSKITENNALTPIGYWVVKLDEQQLTAGSSDCGRICLDVDYYNGENRIAGLTHDVNKGTGCQELHLAAKKVCRIENGVYYGPDGNPITEEEFKKICTCRIDNGKYYDNSGNEVTREVYESQCTCRIENGKYYNGSGVEVSQQQYERDCTCRINNGKYYGRDGNEITKEQYDKDCVPKTGSFASYAVLAAGALIALSAIMIAQKHNRFYKV